MDAVIYNPGIGSDLEPLPGPGIHVADIASAVSPSSHEMSPPGIPAPSDHKRLPIVYPLLHFPQAHRVSVGGAAHSPIVQDHGDTVPGSIGTVEIIPGIDPPGPVIGDIRLGGKILVVIQDGLGYARPAPLIHGL